MFVIIDTFAHTPVVSGDLEGNAVVFDTPEDAEEYAKKYMQPGYYKVVDLTGVKGV